jgi:hypothetical protein
MAIPAPKKEALLGLVAAASTKPESWKSESDCFEGAEIDAYGALLSILLSDGAVSGLLDFTTLDGNEFFRLTTLRFDGSDLSGTVVELASLPKTLEVIDFALCNAGIVFDAATLPRGLRRLNLSSCRAQQRFDAASLTFSGQVLDVSQLPSTLYLLNLSNTDLCGEVDWKNGFKHLEHLVFLELSGNPALSGDVSFADLPPRLHRLSIDGCSFSGVGIVSDLPPTMMQLFVQENPELLLRADFAFMSATLSDFYFGGAVNESMITDLRTSEALTRLQFLRAVSVMEMLRQGQGWIQWVPFDNEDAASLMFAIVDGVRETDEGASPTGRAKRVLARILAGPAAGSDASGGEGEGAAAAAAAEASAE